MHQANQVARNRLEDENMTLKEQLAQAEAHTRKKEAELDDSMDEVIALIKGLQEENGRLRGLLKRAGSAVRAVGAKTLAKEIKEVLK
jgi:DUF1680 family protein